MGFIKEQSILLEESSLGDVVGPIVSLTTYDLASAAWRATVLIACKEYCIDKVHPSKISFNVGQTGKTQDAAGESMMLFRGWAVLRFPLVATLADGPAMLRYSIKLPNSAIVFSGTVHLPARTANWHVAVYSCNDQRQLPKVGTAPWKDLLAVHTRKPFHLVAGTGDQLYNDNVWYEPGIKRWTDIKDREAMRATALDAAQEEEARAFYFFAYLRWIKFHPLGAALSGLPQKNTWDDHDIFDGWGSYPANLQLCPAFQQIYTAAFSMYGLFQMHTTRERAAADGFFSGADPGLSWLLPLGPDAALGALDMRAGRTRETVLGKGQLEAMEQRVLALPASVKHVVLVSSVPVLYPEVKSLETVLKGVNNIPSLVAKTGVFNKLMNDFGEVELLDDLIDHWSAGPHSDEKGPLLARLRALAAARGVRISLCSGDVHQCGFAYLSSTPDVRAAASDPGFIPQFITSAIGYDPPDNKIVAVLDRFAGTGAREIAAAGTGHGGVPAIALPSTGPGGPMYETIGWLFADAQTRPARSTRFANRNNWLELEFAPARALAAAAAEPGLDATPGAVLRAVYHVRRGTANEGEDAKPDLGEHEVLVPPLLPVDRTAGAAAGAVSAAWQAQLSAYAPQRPRGIRAVPCIGPCFGCLPCMPC